MPRAPDPLSQLDRLSERVASGDVVFFIGAGFSLDSEHNTAQRLIRRLLARTVAYAWCAHSRAGGRAEGKAMDLLQGLFATFELGAETDLGGDPEPLAELVAGATAKLAWRYYEFNEWVCNAFDQLLQSGPDDRDLPSAVNALERTLLRHAGGDDVDLPEPELGFWRRMTNGVHRQGESTNAGKGLFLDTMGFDLQEIMAGAPREPDRETGLESFRGRILPRHVAIARLAREGLCANLITTNFDLLFEGAFRLVGLDNVLAEETAGKPRFPPTSFSLFCPVGRLDDYVEYGDGRRIARIIKIHGCADRYRVARERAMASNATKRDLRALHDVLNTFVFTFRQIQNWRDDSWARDQVRASLRMSTMTFAGYSTEDQVVHDTVRDVYEELALQLSDSTHDRQHEDARAFFMDIDDKKAFHGLEVLRAASQAIGVRDPLLVAHPNLVNFAMDPRKGLGIDDQLRWLVHRTLRRKQLQVLSDQLTRLGPTVLGHPVPEDADVLVANATRLVEQEPKRVRRHGSLPDLRAALRRACRWTECFVGGYLRAAAFARSGHGPNAVQWSHRNLPSDDHWHAPIQDFPLHAAWSLVLELALRRMVAALRSESATDAWVRCDPACEVAEHSVPTVLFQEGPGWRSPRAVVLTRESIGPLALPENTAVVESYRRWLVPTGVWSTEGRADQPSARDVWSWAVGTPRQPDPRPWLLPELQRTTT